MPARPVPAAPPTPLLCRRRPRPTVPLEISGSSGLPESELEFLGTRNVGFLLFRINFRYQFSDYPNARPYACPPTPGARSKRAGTSAAARPPVQCGAVASNVRRARTRDQWILGASERQMSTSGRSYPTLSVPRTSSSKQRRFLLHEVENLD